MGATAAMEVTGDEFDDGPNSLNAIMSRPDCTLADALEEACQTDKPNWPDLALALGFSDVSSLNRFCQRNFKMSLGQLALRSRARDPEN